MRAFVEALLRGEAPLAATPAASSRAGERPASVAPSAYALAQSALDLDLDNHTRELLGLYLSGASTGATNGEKEALAAALAACRPRPARGASEGRVNEADAANTTSPASGEILTNAELARAVDSIEQKAGAAFRGTTGRPGPAQRLSSESQGARLLFDAVKDAGGANVFIDPTLVAGLGRWADALPAIAQRVAAGGRVSQPEGTALLEGTHRAAAALRVMAMAPHHGLLRRLLLSSLLSTPQALARQGAPLDRAQIEQLGESLIRRLRFMGGVPPNFRQTGLEAIRDTQAAGLLNPSQREALEQNFNSHFDAHAHGNSHEHFTHGGTQGAGRTGASGEHRSSRPQRQSSRSGFTDFVTRLFSRATRTAPVVAAAVQVGSTTPDHVVQALRTHHGFDADRLRELKADLDGFLMGRTGALSADAFDRKYAAALSIPVGSVAHRKDYARLWQALA